MAFAKFSKGRSLSGVAANAGESSRTITLVGDEMKRALDAGVCVSLSKRTAATAITVAIYKSANGGRSWGAVPALGLAGTGVAAAKDYSISKAVTAVDSIFVDVNIRNCDGLKIVVGATGGGAGDLLDADVMLYGEV